VIHSAGPCGVSEKLSREKLCLIIHLKMFFFKLQFKGLVLFSFGLQGKRMGMLSSRGIAVR